MTRNTMDNRMKLAREQVDSWDLKDLIYYATTKHGEYLNLLTDEEFDKEWKDFYVLED